MSNTRETWGHVLMNTYGTPAVTMVRGSGATLYDDNGNSYIDFLAGIAVNSLGYAHPKVVEAVSRQVGKLAHVSNLLASTPVVEAGAKLIEHFAAGDEDVASSARVFFCNSGAEANEAAFKLARKTGRRRILAANHGFHGRTMGALAMTGQPDKKEAFHPFPAGVEFYPYGDADYVRQLVEINPKDTAAIILEPIQGETGVIPAPEGFLAEVRSLCDEHGILMIADEVQTGAGRTGKFFAWQHEGVRPDVVTMAKGLGAGLPIGACLAWGEAAQLFVPGDHGTTFGGNPVSCAAAGVVLDTLTPDFLTTVEKRGQLLRSSLEALPQVEFVRGRGLMLAAVLKEPIAKQAVAQGLTLATPHAQGATGTAEACGAKGGVVLNATGANVLRFVPPLVITEKEITRGVKSVSEILRSRIEILQL